MPLCASDLHLLCGTSFERLLCLFVPMQEEMYSYVTAAGDQTTKGKGPVVVQDS